MVKFNHDCSAINESLGIDENRADELQASIMFEIINQQYMVESLFDDVDQAPRNLATKSGCLERIFEHASNEEERIYCTWEYTKLDIMHNVAPEAKMGLMALKIMFERLNMDYDRFVQFFVKKKHEAKSERDDD